ncbi:MAG: hypothetical protein II064_05840, partial [Bacteroidales bacterium]|nr:hypothetical protein [Bacteroidales bacterium]
WIKPFQEKLGDYELELPAASPRRHGWIALALTGAAAAAAALLLLLPTTGRPSRENPIRLLAEVPANVAVPTLSAPAQLLTPVRKQPGQPEESAAPTQVTAQEPAQEPAQETAPELVQEPAQDPVQASAQLPQPFEQPEEEKASGFSVRLHASPLAFSLDELSSFGGSFDQALPHSGEKIKQGDAKYDSVDNYNTNHLFHLSEPLSVNCALPVKTGFSLILPLSKGFALESGIDYAFHQATVTYGITNIATIQEDYRMHYLGIPVKAVFSLADWEKAHLYATCGGEMEWMIAGRVQSKDAVRATAERLRIKEHPLLFSLMAAAGIEYGFNARLGLYAEPGIAWHFKPQGTLPNYYREHPLAFDLHLGLRFNLF